LKYEGELMIEGQSLGLKVGVAGTIEGKGVVLQWQCLSVWWRAVKEMREALGRVDECEVVLAAPVMAGRGRAEARLITMGEGWMVVYGE